MLANTTIVQTPEQLAVFEEWFNANERVSIDTETAPKIDTIWDDKKKKLRPLNKAETRDHAVNYRLCKLVGISASNGIDNWYIPIGHLTADPQVSLNSISELFKRRMGKVLFPIFHNAKFDIKILSHHLGIDMWRIKPFDTLIGHFYFNQEESHKLKYLAKAILTRHKLTRDRMKDIEVKYLDDIFDGRRMDTEPIDIVGDYAAKDAYFTWLLWEILEKKFTDTPKFQKAFDTIHMPLVQVLSKAELTGISMNIDRLTVIKQKMEEEKDGIEQEIIEKVGYPFNISSPAQLGKILYGSPSKGGLGLPIKDKTKPSKTKPNGQPSTKTQTLLKLITLHEVPMLLVKYRKIAKRIEAFADPLMAWYELTGSFIISPDFNICGARSGRLSCKNPNMQQMPKTDEKAEDHYDIRSLFVPRPGHTFIVYDYSQLELRVLAHISGDEELTKAYLEGADVHQRTADFLGVTRPVGKNMQFAAVYGAAGQKLADMFNEKKKPNEPAATKEQMNANIKKYWQLYAGVKDWKEIKEFVIQRDGFVETLAKRKRFLPGHTSSDDKVFFKALRAGVNTAIQGSAADIVNLAMVKVFEDEEISLTGCILLLQIHDELLFECPIETAEDASVRIKEIMEHPFKVDLKVPLIAEGGVTPTWSH